MPSAYKVAPLGYGVPYPRGTLHRSRGVRFGQNTVVQWRIFHASFLSLPNVQPTAVGEHAPHPFQGAIPKPLHPHVEADYLCQEDADSRQFHLSQAHVQPHAEADAIVEDDAHEGLADIVGECHASRLCQPAKQQQVWTSQHQQT